MLSQQAQHSCTWASVPQVPWQLLRSGFVWSQPRQVMIQTVSREAAVPTLSRSWRQLSKLGEDLAELWKCGCR